MRDVLAGSAPEENMFDEREEVTVLVTTPIFPAPPTGKRRVATQVYKGEGTLEYRARPPAGTTRIEWRADLRRILASSSPAFVDACLRRLIGACTLPGQAIPRRRGFRPPWR